MRLLTVGHGTLEADAFSRLLGGARVGSLVDVRTAPGSRRAPWFGRADMAVWLPRAGVAYRWERDLGGFRRSVTGSPNVAIRNPSFRGFADHMRTGVFLAALDALLATAVETPTAAMCAESVWWRCHRRMIADAATLLHGGEVVHLMHDGGLEPHRLTAGVRRDGKVLVYDGGPGAAP